GGFRGVEAAPAPGHHGADHPRRCGGDRRLRLAVDCKRYRRSQVGLTRGQPMRPLLAETLLAVLAAALSWSLIGLYTYAMAAARRLTHPNARSMHRIPVPAGAGLAIVATALLLWPLWQPGAVQGAFAVLAA